MHLTQARPERKLSQFELARIIRFIIQSMLALSNMLPMLLTAIQINCLKANSGTSHQLELRLLLETADQLFKTGIGLFSELLDLTFTGPHTGPNFTYFALHPISNPLTK